MISPYTFAKKLGKHLHIVLFMCLLIPAITDAAGLGKLKVKSYLGETLDADIELVETSVDELPSLTARIANNDEYVAAGLQDSVVPSGIKINAVQRADGVRILHLTSTRPINEPFLELLISVNSETLHLVRQYTMLLDPPNSKLGDDGNPLPGSANRAPVASRTYEMINPSGASSAIAPSTAQSAKARRKVARDDSGSDTNSSKATEGSQVTEQLAEKPVKAKRYVQPIQLESVDKAVETKSAEVASGDAQTYITQKGDIFGKVAQQYQPAGVSLKKVMAAFYKANPDAFLDGDINQLKAGQVLRIPDIAGTQLTHAGADAPSSEVKPTIKNTATISNKPADANTGYVLKISPGDANPKSDEQDNNQARINQAAPNAQSAVSVAQPIVDVSPVPPTNSEALPPADPLMPPPAPIAVVPQAPAPAIPPVIVQPSFTQNLQWIFIGMLIPVTIFLLIFLFNLRRQAKMRRLQDGVFGSIQSSKSTLENADTIFGQEVTSTDEDATNTEHDSLPQAVHPHDQTIIDIDEIDPLVEAEIYISYGRDEQAESILTHALETSPERHELSYRLLVIYAGRHDLASFERYAKAVKDAAERGAEEDVVIWGKVAILGSQIDAENPLYNIEDMQLGAAAAEAELPVSNVELQSEQVVEEDTDPFSDSSVAAAETLEFPPLELTTPPAKRFQQLSATDQLPPIEQHNSTEDHVIEFTLLEETPRTVVPEPPAVKNQAKPAQKNS